MEPRGAVGGKWKKAKKQKTPTELNLLWTILLFPLRFALNAVFVPLDIFCFIVVDKLSAPGKVSTRVRELILKICRISDERWDSFTAYITEYRQVLKDYYPYPNYLWDSYLIAPSHWACSKCGKEANWYTMETNSKFCNQCAYNWHGITGTYANLFTVEEIIKEDDVASLEKRTHTVRFLTPVLPELLLILGLIRLYCLSVIQEDYLTTQQICPMVNELRSLTAYLDATALYQFKSVFASWCHHEDSFMRVIMDFWVRGVVLGDDNLLLVFQSVKAGLLFGVVVLIAVLPIIVMPYAMLMYVIDCVERYTPRFKEDGSGDGAWRFKRLFKFLLKMEAFCFWVRNSTFSFYYWFAALKNGNYPPLTIPRKKAPWDSIERLWHYRYRLYRLFKYYYDSALAGLQSFVWHLAVFTVVARVVCIWRNWSGILQAIVYYLPTYRKHSKWFANNGAGNGFFFSHSRLWKATSTAGQVVEIFVFGVPYSLRSLIMVAVVFFIIAVVSNLWFCHYIIQQQRNFNYTYGKGDPEYHLKFFVPDEKKPKESKDQAMVYNLVDRPPAQKKGESSGGFGPCIKQNTVKFTN
jgi:hypothetical protein